MTKIDLPPGSLDAAAAFSELESTVVRFPIPGKLLTGKKNTLSVQIKADALRMELGAKDGAPAPNAPPLAVRYAVLKCRVGNKD